jgi:amino acid efflux transporter
MTITRGIALYIGALLGPGLLLLPGLAAAEAGPASVLAWAGLLLMSALFAAVFAALGRAQPGDGGVAAYTEAGLGASAGAAARGCFLTGMVCGAPVVCLTGASYVTSLAGGGIAVRCLVAMVLLLAALALVSRGLRASSGAQLVLVFVLVVVITVAVAGAAPAARAAHWAPFAPDGWGALGHAASTMMFSFFGWEAVAPLTGKFRDPGRQLPRVIAVTVLVTTVIYLSLAIATIAVLGRDAATDVPVAALLVRAVGGSGRVIAAVVAIVLTLGTLNACLSGVVTMAGGRNPRRRHLPLVPVGIAGSVLIALYGAGVVTTGDLVGLPVTLLLFVYAGCTLSAVRTLRGAARVCAGIAVTAVATLLAFCGWPLALAAVTALVSIGLRLMSCERHSLTTRFSAWRTTAISAHRARLSRWRCAATGITSRPAR